MCLSAIIFDRTVKAQLDIRCCLVSYKVECNC